MAEEERRPDAQDPDTEPDRPEAAAADEGVPEGSAGDPGPEDAGEQPASEEGGEQPAPEEGGEPPAPEPSPTETVEPEPAAEAAEPGEPERRRSADRSAEEQAGKRETVPGAELDPIAIEPERELSAEERARLEAEAEERAKREAEATAEGEEPAVRLEAAVQIPAEARIQATGKRKNSIARVIVRAGDGRFEVNRRGLDEYFPRAYLQTLARQPLVTAGYEGAVDVSVRVHGGGVSGQAGAVRHGVARALCEIDPELRGELKRRGLLTRDARAKERRKAGLKKARKRPQFSKR